MGIGAGARRSHTQDARGFVRDAGLVELTDAIGGLGLLEGAVDD